MSKLSTLAPRIGTRSAVRVPLLAAKPGVEKRIQGRAGVKMRQQAKRAAGHLCVRCTAEGRVRAATVVDHRVPLWQGGSNEPSNLDPLCDECHSIKSASEATQRARGLGG